MVTASPLRIVGSLLTVGYFVLGTFRVPFSSPDTLNFSVETYFAGDVRLQSRFYLCLFMHLRSHRLEVHSLTKFCVVFKA
jgi:hypothetical protein